MSSILIYFDSKKRTMTSSTEDRFVFLEIADVRIYGNRADLNINASDTYRFVVVGDNGAVVAAADCYTSNSLSTTTSMCFRCKLPLDTIDISNLFSSRSQHSVRVSLKLMSSSKDVIMTGTSSIYNNVLPSDYKLTYVPDPSVITGPRGAQGLKGDKGDKGIQGTQGVPGPIGPTGATGADSTVQGPKGDKGDTGPEGPKGDTGADSTVQGPKGDKGDTGPEGPKGDTGADSTVQGPKGDKGDTGPEGPKGDTGAIGPKGDTGLTGQYCKSNGSHTHAEGYFTVASGIYSHAEGRLNNSKGIGSHVEGYKNSTSISGKYAHAEGYDCVADGFASHAEGLSTKSVGKYSHVQGNNTIGSADYQFVAGHFNLDDVSKSLIFGCGTNNVDRKNALTITPSGKIEAHHQIVDTDEALATKKYVDDADQNSGAFVPEVLTCTQDTVAGNLGDVITTTLKANLFHTYDTKKGFLITGDSLSLDMDALQTPYKVGFKYYSHSGGSGHSFNSEISSNLQAISFKKTTDVDGIITIVFKWKVIVAFKANIVFNKLYYNTACPIPDGVYAL